MCLKIGSADTDGWEMIIIPAGQAYLLGVVQRSLYLWLTAQCSDVEEIVNVLSILTIQT